jgi:hypothetical protein
MTSTSAATPAALATEPRVHRRDNDCHNYQVPESLATRFDTLMAAIFATTEGTDAWYEANDDLNAEFEDYRAN